ncbi:caspase family protein [uncultured Microscilla sp.]|uniref:caspase family protein n=1 Tax=uncultured Microscilla sp. TaxID=432653 RepID=UPI002609C8D6|nr:caspase family protein [uncultured Microscilla sp.]
MPKQQKIFALLVGINQYHPASSVTPLNGCIADIEATEKLLKEDFKVASGNICKLTNEQATHENIVDHFQRHLIANAAPDTTLLFWFSGHGSRQRTDPRFYKYLPEENPEDLRDETLVCYDSRAIVKGIMPNPDLADKELAVLIDLAAQKGGDIVTIFDCCHSGDITRSDPDHYERARLIKDRDERESELSRDYGKPNESFSRNYLGGYYQKHQLDRIPKGKHLLLAACQYYETAKECTIDGDRRGIFSYYLQNVIAQNPAITYSNLFEQLRSMIAAESTQRNFSSPQTPQFMAYAGFDTHQLIFTQQKPEYLSDKYEITYSNEQKEWQIKYGANQGLPTSGKVIKFDVYDHPPLQKAATEGYVKSVEANYSTLTFEQKLSPKKRYWGALTQLDDVPVYVNLEGDFTVQNELHLFIKKHGTIYFAVDNTKKHAFRVNISQGHWQLFKDKQTEALVNEPFTPGKVFHKLNRLGRWHLLRSNQHKNTRFKLPEFNFRVEDTLHNQVLKGSNAFQSKTFVCTLNEEEEWILDAEIKGQNYTDKELFFALLYFTSDYSIRVPYNKCVSANKLFVIDNQEFVMEPGNTTAECIQLMVSTEKIESHFLSQEGLTSADTGRAMREKKRRTDWCTVTMELNLAKK